MVDENSGTLDPAKGMLSKKSAKNDRPERYVSHALVEVRRFKHLPLFVHSAILLDISIAGFKLEFTAEIKVNRGEIYWLHVPLTPLGIFAPKRIICQSEVRWFEEKNYRMGGVFINLSKTDRLIIDQAIETLRRQGIIA